MSVDTAALVARLWERYGGVARERVTELQQLSPVLLAGAETEEQRDRAVRLAHQLAGALGTYGRPGSAAAAAVEQLLLTDADRTPLSDLLGELRDAVDPTR